MICIAHLRSRAVLACLALAACGTPEEPPLDPVDTAPVCGGFAGACASGTACVDGRCRPLPGEPCSASTGCVGGFSCVGGFCRGAPGARCSERVACVDGAICEDALCRAAPGAACDGDSPCASGLLCADRVCLGDLGAACGGDGDCAGQYDCVDGSCVEGGLCAVNHGGCDANADCSNGDDDRECTCREGWSGDGLTCVDIDECLTDRGGCDANAVCANIDGGRLCTCQEGWSGDGLTCADVDECAGAEHDCGPGSVCNNTPGAWECACKPGYTGDGTSCTDINECETDHGGCDVNATCENTPGSRSCTCNEGWSGDGFDCRDAVVDAFSFEAVQELAPGQLVGSAPVTLSGFEGPLTAVCAGCVALARNEVWTANDTSRLEGLMAGDTLALRQLASDEYATETTATVTVGLSAPVSWSVTTRAQDRAPDVFAFVQQNGVAAGTTVTSNPRRVTNFDGPLTATCVGCVAIARDGVWGGTSVEGFMPDDLITLRATVPASGLGLATVTLGETTSEVWKFQTADGSIEHPFPISTCSELQRLDRDKHSFLANDVDCAESSTWNDGAGFMPLTGLSVDASFDGRGHTIRDLYIDRPDRTAVALFGSSGGLVKNVRLENVDFRGKDHVAGVAGTNSGTIENVAVTGSLDANVTSSSRSGGIAGDNFGTITGSFAAVHIIIGTSGYQSGGLVGFNFGPPFALGRISNSYAIADFTLGAGGSQIGGLTGGNYGIIENSYAAGTAAIYGLVGTVNGNGSVTASYWDTSTGPATSEAGVGKTTVELATPTSNTGIYATWSTEIWDFGTGEQSPALKALPGGLAGQPR